MHKKMVFGFVAVLLMLTGCTSSTSLTQAGQQINMIDEQPAAECQFLGAAEGKQSNWVSGTRSEFDSTKSAINDLRNKAAAMGGNTLFGVEKQGLVILSGLLPVDSVVRGDVYRCPN